MPKVKYPQLVEFIRNNSHLSDKEIADAIGCSTHLVSVKRRKVLNIKKDLSIKFPPSDVLESIVRDYVSGYMSRRQLAEKYQLPAHHIVKFLKSAGVVMMQKTERNNKKLVDNFHPHPELEDMIIGTLCGDAHIRKPVNQVASYKVSHSLKQLPYLLHKKSILDSSGFSTGTSQGEKSIDQCVYRGMTIRTSWTNFWLPYRDLFYPRGIKVWSSALAERLTPRALAYWFGDDGSVSEHLDDGYRFYSLSSAFFIDEALAHDFASLIKNKFNIRLKVDDLSKKGSVRTFRVATEDIFKFADLISPPLPGVAYKFPPQRKFQLALNYNNIETAFDYYRANGFPYVSLSPERRSEEYHRLTNFNLSQVQIKNQANEWRYSQIAINLVNHYFPNLVLAQRRGQRSMMQVFNDDQLLRKVLFNRVRYGRSFDPEQVLLGLKLVAHPPTNFPPLIARLVYERYCPAQGKVIDFSSGYGGRALGFSASSYGIEYLGIDPNSESVKNTKLMLQEYAMNKKLEFIEKGAESIDWGGIYDCCFTSPPYFDYEIYNNDPNQVSSLCSTADDYHVWVTEIAKKLQRHVRGPVILHLCEVPVVRKKPLTIRKMWCDILVSQGYYLSETIRLRMSKSPTQRERVKYEFLDVFLPTP